MKCYNSLTEKEKNTFLKQLDEKIPLANLEAAQNEEDRNFIRAITLDAVQDFLRNLMEMDPTKSSNLLRDLTKEQETCDRDAVQVVENSMSELCPNPAAKKSFTSEHVKPIVQTFIKDSLKEIGSKVIEGFGFQNIYCSDLVNSVASHVMAVFAIKVLHIILGALSGGLRRILPNRKVKKD